MEKQVELLAPAGSFESIQAAMAAGADAVYVGGLKFGARAYANNLDEETMCRAIDFVHLHGGKLYMTVNTLLKDAELETLSKYLRPYYCQGLDGVIIQDLGVFAHIQREFPQLALHASTQMTLLGGLGASLLKELGAARIVPARELSLEEIRRIKEETEIEVEAFVHGAMCYCYSGQCLFSSMLGGRSGNRGRCAQPCRLPYQVKTGERQSVLSEKAEPYLLSLRDMCTVEQIPDLIEAGIDSFKIEGRMKRPEYTAGVVSIYRKYIDVYQEYGREKFRVKPEDKDILSALYNRSGFSGGYYVQRNGRSMLSLSRPNHFDEKSRKALEEKRRYEALIARLRQQYVDREKKEKIQGSLRLSKETYNVFQVEYRGVKMQVEGPPAQEPKNQPMSEEQVLRQMKKTGNTPFEWETLEIQMDGAVFVPIQNLNELRRRGLEALEKAFADQYHRESPENKKDALKNCKGEKWMLPTDEEIKTENSSFIVSKENRKVPLLRVQAEEPRMLPLVLKEPGIDGVYVNAETFFHIQMPLNEKALEKGQRLTPSGVVQLCKEAGRECYLVLPDIFRLKERQAYDAWYPEFEKAGFTGVLLKNLEELQFLKEHGYGGKIVPDANLYTFNRETKELWRSLGAAFATLPFELNERELRQRGCQEDELVIYGYQPLMVTANCLAKTLKRCKKQPGFLYLEDRYQKLFPVRCSCESCYNVIYNSAPLYLLDCADAVSRLCPQSLRLHFTIEREAQIQQILPEAAAIFKEGKCPSLSVENFTRGHLKRGVE